MLTVNENFEIFTKSFYGSQVSVHQISALVKNCFYFFMIFEIIDIFDWFFIKILLKIIENGGEIVYNLEEMQ